MLRLLTGIAVATVLLVASVAWWLLSGDGRVTADLVSVPQSFDAPRAQAEKEAVEARTRSMSAAERSAGEERAKADAQARAQLATAMREAEGARREAEERQRARFQERLGSGSETAGGSPAPPGRGGFGSGGAVGGSSGTGSAPSAGAGGSGQAAGASSGQAGAAPGQVSAPRDHPFSLSSLAPASPGEPVAAAAPAAPAQPSPPAIEAKRVKTVPIRVNPQTTSPSAAAPAANSQLGTFAPPPVAAPQVAVAAMPPPAPPSAAPPAPAPSRAGQPAVVSAAAAPAASALPEFQWPPPAASAWVVIPDDLIARRAQPRPSFGDVRDRLGRALDAAGYSQRTFFSVPNGFAIVTQLERIGDDGTPTSARRWFTAGSTEIFSLEEYLKRLLFAEAGRYRLVVLVVTDVSISATGPYITAGQAAEMADNGVMDLPPSVAAREFSADHRSTALIYEFRKRRTGEPEFVKRSPLPGRDHLIKARIWAAIENILRTR